MIDRIFPRGMQVPNLIIAHEMWQQHMEARSRSSSSMMLIIQLYLEKIIESNKHVMTGDIRHFYEINAWGH